jgi:RNA polymerase sigma-70 factor (ECF subfamily)
LEKNANSREHPAGYVHLKGGQQGNDGKDGYVQDCQDSLVARLSAGNRDAATELVESYYQQIYLLMRRLGHGRQVSEDLTQECFLQAWQHIGQLRSNRALKGWIYRIAINISKQYWRRYRGGKEMIRTENIVLQNGKEDESQTEHFERLYRLNDAVVKLPIKFREAIVLHYMQHLTIDEAASAAGIAKGTFKSRLNRALKKLRKQLAL